MVENSSWRFNIIAAYDLNHGIGKNNSIPWYLPSDIEYFRNVTMASTSNKFNSVIMGLKTWESISPEYRPLDQRINIILTRQNKIQVPSGVFIAHSLNDAFEIAQNESQTCFVIGGAMLYSESLQHPGCDLLYLTEIFAQFDCDLFFPPYGDRFTLISESEIQNESNIKYVFKIYKSK